MGQPPIFLCPSAAGRQADPNGYGVSDYMPVAYTDIDFTTGLRNKPTASPGMLQAHREITGWNADGSPQFTDRGGATMASTTAPQGKTICLIEDTGKKHHTPPPFTNANHAVHSPTCQFTT